MFSLKTVLLPLLALSGLCASAPTTRSYLGAITAPTPGTAVQPGEAFSFSYMPHADYGISSFAYHVWLFTGPASSDAAGALAALAAGDASGYYFGRFDYPNYPGEFWMYMRRSLVNGFGGITAVPYAKNPAPAQLTMPDFATSPGGFAAGATGSNVNMQLVVIEEWGTGQVRAFRSL